MWNVTWPQAIFAGFVVAVILSVTGHGALRRARHSVARQALFEAWSAECKNATRAGQPAPTWGEWICARGLDRYL